MVGGKLVIHLYLESVRSAVVGHGHRVEYPDLVALEQRAGVDPGVVLISVKCIY